MTSQTVPSPGKVNLITRYSDIICLLFLDFQSEQILDQIAVSEAELMRFFFVALTNGNPHFSGIKNAPGYESPSGFCTKGAVLIMFHR